jgi:tetratricopeptide (TPR) repeat protein
MGLSSLRAVGVALAHDGRFDEATRLAVAIETAPRPTPSADPFPPSQILPPDLSDGSTIWEAIAIAQAKKGDPTGATSALNKSRGSSGMAAQLELYDEQLRRGNAASAMAMLDQAARGALPEQIAGVAERYARAGRRDDAAALLRRAITDLTGVGKWYPSIRRELAVSLVRLGYPHESIQFLQHDDEAKPGLVDALLETNQIELARSVAESLPPGGGMLANRRSAVLAALAQKHHTMGQTAEEEGFWQAARLAADAQPHPGLRVQALLALGSRMHKAGRASKAQSLFDRALALATSLPRSDRDGALRHVTSTHARLGQCERALEIAATIGGSGYAIREIAAECTNPRDLDRIEARIGAIEYPDHRAEALTDLAVQYGQAGRAPQALSVIARIDDRNMKAKALGALAAVLTSGDAAALTACP